MSQTHRPTPRTLRGPLLGLLLAFALALPAAAADRVRLAEDAPDEYVVQTGDTLWDISGMFLQDPWQWPQIWQVNPEIQNPHLIYPGDVIRLIWVNGEPQLVVNQEEPVAMPQPRDEGMPTVRLSPQIRELPLDAAVDPIPWDAIGPFLSRPSVVDRDALLTAPYVLSTQDGHLMAGTDDDVYIRGTSAGEGTGYRIVKLGQEYRDPVTDDLLGYEAIHVGEGFVIRPGDPATFRISSANREVLEGNRLLPASSGDLDRAFQPQQPAVPVDGRVMAVVDGIASVGRYQIVVLNVGASAGLRQGDVLAIFQTNEEVDDRYADEGRFFGGMFAEEVQLPESRAGELMVFRVSPNISYALITRSARDIHVGDAVRNP